MAVFKSVDEYHKHLAEQEKSKVVEDKPKATPKPKAKGVKK